jgi:hypothetical protein
MHRIHERLAACALAAKYVSADDVYPRFLEWAFHAGYFIPGDDVPSGAFLAGSSRHVYLLIRETESELLSARLRDFLPPGQ